MHPTVKPTALVADAMRDCSRRGETVLDIFAGSGTTAIAAEVCGRNALLLEYDPLYCDTIVRRWETFTGKRTALEASNQTFEQVGGHRLTANRTLETDTSVSRPRPLRHPAKRAAGDRS